MRQVFLNIVLSFSLLAGTTLASAQDGFFYSTSELSPSDGYPSHITSIDIFEDVAFLSSPSGLCRVANGLLEVSNTTRGDSFRLPSDYVYKVSKDKEGNFWVLTVDGIQGIKPSDGIHSLKIIEGVPEDAVAFSAYPDESCIYFGGENKIWQYDYHTGRFDEVVSFETETPFAISRMINGYDRVLLFSPGQEPLFLFYPQSKTVEKFSLPIGAGVSDCLMDSRFNLWIAQPDIGVSCYDDSHELKKVYNMRNGLSSDIPLCLLEKEGKIWVGTYGGGINIIDPESQKVTVMSQDPEDPISFPNNFITALALDATGAVWAGTPQSGAFVITQTGVTSVRYSDIRPTLGSGGFKTFAYDEKEDDLWMGTIGSGILKIDMTTGNPYQYASTDGLSVSSLVLADDDRVMFTCAPQGAYVLDKKSGRIQRMFKEKRIADYTKYADEGATVCPDAAGRIIDIADSVYRYTLSNDKLESFPLPEGTKGRLEEVSGSKAQFFFDRSRVYSWDELSPSRLSVLYESESGEVLRSAAFSRNNVIWVAVKGGLVRINASSGATEMIPLYLENVPLTVFFDRYRNGLFIGTSSMLYLYYTDSGRLLALDAAHGAFKNMYESKAKAIDRVGNVYLGGHDGFVRIQNDSNFQTGKAPIILLKNVVIDGIALDDFSNLSVTPSMKTLDIVFEIKDNNILSTTPCHFFLDSPKLGRTEYYLDVPEFHFSANLPSGHYVISGSCLGSDGNWTTESNLYEFEVEKPWYASSIFYALLALFSILIVLLTVKITKYRDRLLRQGAREASEERYNFLVNVSHELRTPLTLVSGPLKRLLKSGEMGDNEREIISRVCLQAERMTTLLNTILTTNKIQENGMSLQYAPVALADWLNSCVDDFRDEANGYKMDIIVKSDPELSHLLMDPALCKIVFSNVMSNAIKHNEPGRPISVWVDWNKSTGYARISVRDHGSGIGNVEVSTLFEKYYQATEEHTGFGIGLSYSKAIVDAHDGNIGAYNNSNDKGATFWFELPARFAVSGQNVQESRQVKSAAGKDGSGPLKDKVILFVDDDRDLRSYVKEELERVSGTVLMAYNGHNALDVLSKNKVDVVITDVMMPEMDGIELCKAIKVSPKWRDVVVIVLTARADESSRQRSYAADADYYMPKPFDVDQLINVLEKKI